MRSLANRCSYGINSRMTDRIRFSFWYYLVPTLPAEHGLLSV